jgi:hypothetical protein
MAPDHDWSQFTEAAFRGHLQALKAQGYRFIRFGEDGPGRQVLWRHDVDFSMHRALKLARIEAADGVVATYFVNPRCAFYNLAEPDVTSRLLEIAALGHEIGLHFDAEAYGDDDWTMDRLEVAVATERSLLELILGEPVRVMSWHNPTLSNLLEFRGDELYGLVNAYGDSFRNGYVYCSDSNGYWRFKPMADVIAEGHERLQLLTHPAWWTPEPMAPSERIDRCLQGRAAAVRRQYDQGLQDGGRVNLTARSS